LDFEMVTRDDDPLDEKAQDRLFCLEVGPEQHWPESIDELLGSHRTVLQYLRLEVLGAKFGYRGFCQEAALLECGHASPEGIQRERCDLICVGEPITLADQFLKAALRFL
jgi:hypothetical protein